MFPELHIVAIDDEEFNLLLLEEISKTICPNIVTFTNPIVALQYISSADIDILLVDYMMPQMNGLEVIQHVYRFNQNILIIMITAAGDNESIKLQALENGAIDFLKKPINVSEYRARMKNISKIKHSQIILDDFNTKLEKEVKKATQALQRREEEALQVLSNTVEYKDPETASHIARVAHYSKFFAQEYGLNEKEQKIIFHASPLHDIGKVGIRDDILLKPGHLTEEEMSEMKKHSEIGFNILKEHENPYLQAGAIIAHTHHEKYDGSGYPNALKADNIHIYGRITAIADVFDALTSERPYKQAWDFERAVEFVHAQSNKHFDPILCDIFMNNLEKIRAIHDEFQ